MDQFKPLSSPQGSVRVVVGCGVCRHVSKDATDHADHVKSHALKTMWLCALCNSTAVSIRDVLMHDCSSVGQPVESAVVGVVHVEEKQPISVLPSADVEQQRVKVGESNDFLSMVKPLTAESVVDEMQAAVDDKPTLPANIPAAESRPAPVSADGTKEILPVNAFQSSGLEPEAAGNAQVEKTTSIASNKPPLIPSPLPNLGLVPQVYAHPSLPITCQRCPLKFASNDEMAVHTCVSHPVSASQSTTSDAQATVQQASLRELDDHPQLGREFASPANHLTLTCHVCKIKFSSQKKLIGHLQQHGVKLEYVKIEALSTGGFRCRGCDKVFEAKADAASHRNKEHSLKVFRCPVCASEFLKEGHLEAHMARVHAPADPMPSPSTSERQAVTDESKADMSDDAGEPEVTLTGSNAPGEAPSVLNFACHLCPKRLTDSVSLGTHLKSHNVNVYAPITQRSESEFVCSECGTVSSTKRRAVKHRSAYHKPRLFPCPNSECGLKFMVSEGLEQHVAKEHPGVQFSSPAKAASVPTKPVDSSATGGPCGETKVSKYHCHRCANQYSEVKDLISHLREHDVEVYTAKVVETPSGTFVCDQCGYESTIRSSVVNHRGGKHKPPTFPCRECGAVYLSQAGLQQHAVDTHPGLAISTEAVTPAATVPSAGVPANRGVRHQCHICKTSYAFGKDLIVHLRDHGVEVYAAKVVELPSGMFKCDQCPYEATNRASVTNHRGSKHKPAIFSCDPCRIVYFSEEGRDAHVASVHGSAGTAVGPPVGAESPAARQPAAPHVGQAVNVKAISCPRCDVTVSNQEALERHVRAVHHEGDGSVGDLAAAASYPGKRQLDISHDPSNLPAEPVDKRLKPEPAQQAVALIDPKLLVCGKCAAAFPTEALLSKHEQTCSVGYVSQPFCDSDIEGSDWDLW